MKDIVMEQRDKDESMKLTSAYRREASAVASTLGGATGALSSLQQCLGRNALADASEEPPSLNIPSSLSYCHACGSMLQAGKNGTTLRLRSVGRGKSRRRRASRRKASEFRSKNQSSAASGGRMWRDDNGDEGKEERDLVRVTDGSCRNAVVVTCGSCGWKLKYKGLPPVRQQPTSIKEESKRSAAPSPKELAGDVISLPKKPAGKKPGGKRSRAQGISTAKKQNKNAKSSGLLDFLSSLND